MANLQKFNFIPDDVVLLPGDVFHSLHWRTRAGRSYWRRLRTLEELMDFADVVTRYPSTVYCAYCSGIIGSPGYPDRVICKSLPLKNNLKTMGVC